MEKDLKSSSLFFFFVSSFGNFVLVFSQYLPHKKASWHQSGPSLFGKFLGEGFFFFYSWGKLTTRNWLFCMQDNRRKRRNGRNRRI